MFWTDMEKELVFCSYKRRAVARKHSTGLELLWHSWPAYYTGKQQQEVALHVTKQKYIFHLLQIFHIQGQILRISWIFPLGLTMRRNGAYLEVVEQIRLWIGSLCSSCQLLSDIIRTARLWAHLIPPDGAVFSCRRRDSVSIHVSGSALAPCQVVLWSPHLFIQHQQSTPFAPIWILRSLWNILFS